MLSGNIKLSEEFGAGKRKAIVASGGELDALEFEFNEGLTQGTSGYLRAAAAIKKIHDGKLYLKYAETFGEYCKLRLGKSRSAVYQQLQKLAISEATGEVYSTAVQTVAYPEGFTQAEPIKTEVLPPKTETRPVKKRLDDVDKARPVAEYSEFGRVASNRCCFGLQRSKDVGVSLHAVGEGHEDYGH